MHELLTALESVQTCMFTPRFAESFTWWRYSMLLRFVMLGLSSVLMSLYPW